MRQSEELYEAAKFVAMFENIDLEWTKYRNLLPPQPDGDYRDIYEIADAESGYELCSRCTPAIRCAFHAQVAEVK